jgi:hypothetical protein
MTRIGESVYYDRNQTVRAFYNGQPVKGPINGQAAANPAIAELIPPPGKYPPGIKEDPATGFLKFEGTRDEYLAARNQLRSEWAELTEIHREPMRQGGVRVETVFVPRRMEDASRKARTDMKGAGFFDRGSATSGLGADAIKNLPTYLEFPNIGNLTVSGAKIEGIAADGSYIRISGQTHKLTQVAYYDGSTGANPYYTYAVEGMPDLVVTAHKIGDNKYTVVIEDNKKDAPVSSRNDRLTRFYNTALILR